MPRAIYIPTDRPSTQAIDAALEECRVLAESTGQEYLFLLVEHRDAPHVGLHAKQLANAAGQAGSVRAVHVTPSAWERYLSDVLAQAWDERDRARLTRLLSYPGVAYGIGPNKAALVAAALGIKVLHRRDSDHIPDHREDGIAFPGVLEALVIGRQLADVVPHAAVNEEGARRRVRFVGSSMVGDPALDRRDLLMVDPRLVAAIHQLANPAATAEELRSAVRRNFTDEIATRYEHDFYRLDVRGDTEIGVSCMEGIFLQLPVMPLADTLGTDYVQKNLMYQIGWPVVFHSRKMVHRYAGGRSAREDVGAVTEYALRDLRYLILRRTRSAANEHLRTSPPVPPGDPDQLDLAAYADAWGAALSSEYPATLGMSEHYAAIYRSAAARAEGRQRDRLAAVARAAEELGSGANRDVAEGIADFRWLLGQWERLVGRAREHGVGILCRLR